MVLAGLGTIDFLPRRSGDSDLFPPDRSPGYKAIDALLAFLNLVLIVSSLAFFSP
jgi:hypothetical protein